MILVNGYITELNEEAAILEFRSSTRTSSSRSRSGRWRSSGASSGASSKWSRSVSR